MVIKYIGDDAFKMTMPKLCLAAVIFSLIFIINVLCRVVKVMENLKHTQRRQVIAGFYKKHRNFKKSLPVNLFSQTCRLKHRRYKKSDSGSLARKILSKGKLVSISISNILKDNCLPQNIPKSTCKGKN